MFPISIYIPILSSSDRYKKGDQNTNQCPDSTATSLDWHLGKKKEENILSNFENL